MFICFLHKNSEGKKIVEKENDFTYYIKFWWKERKTFLERKICRKSNFFNLILKFENSRAKLNILFVFYYLYNEQIDKL